MIKEKKIQKRIVIIIWSLLFSLSILMLTLNMIDRVNDENLMQHIKAYVLVGFVFVPSIILYLICSKKNKYNFIKNLIFIIFLLCAFVGIVESGFNSKKTQEQVKNLIQSIQNIKKEPKMKDIIFQISNEKKLYEIGDIISFNIEILPHKIDRERIVYEIDNEIVSINLKDNEIMCLKEGICNITFYDSLNKEIQHNIKIEIKSNGLEKIELNNQKDIFLKVHEEFKLNPTTNLELIDNLNLVYESSNSDVAVIDQNGKITALKSGETTIRCSYGDIYDEVYVYVNSLTNINFIDQEIEVLATKINTTKIKLYMDNAENFKKQNLVLEYYSTNGVAINISTFNIAEKYVIVELENTKDLKEIDEIINLKAIYKFYGGYFVEDNINIKIVSGYDLGVQNIDIEKTKQSTNLVLYYDNDRLVTKFYNKNIYYIGNISEYNVEGYKVIGDSNITILKSSYNSITFAFLNENNIMDKHYIKFYPNKNKEESFQLEFNIIKKQVTNYDASFELRNLYKENENLKNEIWYSYFNVNIFNSILFNNKEFNNSGLVIIPNSGTEDYLTLEINEYGIVTKCELKKRDQMKTPDEVTLEFDICSLYEYNKDKNCEKYKYIVKIRSEYDNLLVSINGEEYSSDDRNISVKKDDTIEIKSKLVAVLENKTNNKEIVSTSIVLKKYSNPKLVTITKDNIKFNEYGNLEIKYYTNNVYCQKTLELNVTISIEDENGNILIKKNLTFDVISYEKDCAPILDKKIFSSGTKLKFNIEEIEKFKFITSNNQILSIDDEGNALCLQTGNVSIYAVNKQNEDEIYSYTLKIYTAVNKVDIINKNFSKLTKQKDNYILKIRNNVVYQFEFSNINDIKYRYIIVENDGFTMFDDGKFQATKSGRYEGYILIGEEDSPYKQKIKFVINSDVIGLSDDTIYFIRKLVGHFGLFMALGFFGMLMLSVFKYFNFKYKIILIIALILHGILVAYSTEFIQGLDPTRTNAIKDVLINCSGYLCGITVIGIVILVKKLIIMVIKKCSNTKLKEGKN